MLNYYGLLKMMKVFYLFSLIILLFLGFLGCSVNRYDDVKERRFAFERGYAKGYTEGYDEGYTKGFAESFPGEVRGESKFLGGLRKLIAYFGGLSVFLILLLSVQYLIGISPGPNDFFGKILMSIFGVVSVFAFSHFSGIHNMLKDLLLQEATNSFSTYFISGFVVAIINVFYKILFIGKENPGKMSQILSVLFFASLIAMIVPPSYYFYTNPNDILPYFGAEIFTGALLGLILYWSIAVYTGWVQIQVK